MSKSKRVEHLLKSAVKYLEPGDGQRIRDLLRDTVDFLPNRYLSEKESERIKVKIKLSDVTQRCCPEKVLTEAIRLKSNSIRRGFGTQLIDSAVEQLCDPIANPFGILFGFDEFDRRKHYNTMIRDEYNWLGSYGISPLAHAWMMTQGWIKTREDLYNLVQEIHNSKRK